MVNLFRITGWLEGSSFLFLMFVAMPLKYIAGNPEAVRVTGMAHGILFIAYIVLANVVAEHLDWPGKVRIYAFIAAVLPFGTFVFERKFLSRK